MRLNYQVIYVALLSLLPECTGSSSDPVPGFDTSAEETVDSIIFDSAAPDAALDGASDSAREVEAGADVHGCDASGGCGSDGPCTENKDCLSGWCVDHLGGSVCTETCIEECPPGWICQQVESGADILFICVSDFPNLCVPCASGADCTSTMGTQASCVIYDGEGSFCGGTCEEDGDCPGGYECQEVETMSGASLFQCVSATGTCECTEKSVELGLSTPCAKDNEFGVCDGVRICTDEGLSVCNADVPTAETCDDLDNDCDDTVDEDTCDDGNSCTDDACEPLVGCVNTPNSAACSDSDVCTTGDVCADGSCTSTGTLTCLDGTPCTTDSCDPATGCVFTINEIPCEDGNACTVNDSCSLGDCQSGEDLDCDDANVCTTDFCNPLSGCENSNNSNPCSDDDLCTTDDVCVEGSCTGSGTLMCDDDDICTDDSCEADLGCVFTNNTIPCDDGDACTVTDVCSLGDCVGSGSLECVDADPCTADSCDPDSGCQFPTIFPCCGNDVTEAGEECDDGNQANDDGCSSICEVEGGVDFQGYAWWYQECDIQSDADQDQIMDDSCDTSHPGARAATTEELVFGLIVGLPATNTSNYLMITKMPHSEGNTVPFCIDGHARKCVGKGAPWPTSYTSGWKTDCYNTSRNAICVK